MKASLVEARGKFLGHTDIDSPVKFAVPLKEVRPTAICRNSICLNWAGKQPEKAFVIGRWYRLKLNPCTMNMAGWQVVEAVEE